MDEKNWTKNEKRENGGGQLIYGRNYKQYLDEKREMVWDKNGNLIWKRTEKKTRRKRSERIAEVEEMFKRLETYDEYFGVKQLMEILGKSENTVRRLISDRKVEANKTSELIYFKKVDVLEYLEELLEYTKLHA